MNLYTWNLEHGSDRWTHINGFPAPDAICIQEITDKSTGMPQVAVDGCSLPVYRGSHQLGSAGRDGSSGGRGRKMAFAMVRFGKTGQNSVGVMLANAMDGIDVVSAEADKDDGTRPAIGLRTGSGTWVYSIHAPSKQGSKWQMGWIQKVLAQIAAKSDSWICAGDFNATPEAVQAVCPPGAEVVRPNQATHRGGGELDFAVCSPGLLSTATVDAGKNSDHWPVKLA